MIFSTFLKFQAGCKKDIRIKKRILPGNIRKRRRRRAGKTADSKKGQKGNIHIGHTGLPASMENDASLFLSADSGREKGTAGFAGNGAPACNKIKKQLQIKKILDFLPLTFRFQKRPLLFLKPRSAPIKISLGFPGDIFLLFYLLPAMRSRVILLRT